MTTGRTFSVGLVGLLLALSACGQGNADQPGATDSVSQTTASKSANAVAPSEASAQWTPPFQLTSSKEASSTPQPIAAFSGDGAVAALAWSAEPVTGDFGDINGMAGVYAEGEWTEPTLVIPSGVATGTCLSRDGSAGWVVGATQQGEVVAAPITDGDIGPLTTIAPYIINMPQPVVGCADKGVAVAVWASDVQGPVDALMLSRFDGTWSEPQPLDLDAEYVGLDLAVAGNGDALVAWEQTAIDEVGPRSSHAAQIRAGEWGKPTTLEVPVDGPARIGGVQACLAANAETGLVAWTLAGEVRSAAVSGREFSAATTVATADNPSFPELAADDSCGNAVLAWVDQTGASVATQVMGAWTVQAVASTASAYPKPTVSLDGSAALVVWGDSATNTLMAMTGASGSWSAGEVIGESADGLPVAFSQPWTGAGGSTVAWLSWTLDADVLVTARD